MILDKFIFHCFLGTTVAAPSHTAVSNMNKANENNFYILTYIGKPICLLREVTSEGKTSHKMHI
jgi:hypothetical protein